MISKKDQARYWHRTDTPYRYLSAREFAEIFKSSDLGEKIKEELSEPYDKSKSPKNALSTSIYSVSKWNLFKACLAREYLLMKRNSFIYIFKSTQVTTFLISRISGFLLMNFNLLLKCCTADYNHWLHNHDSIYTYPNVPGFGSRQLLYGIFVLHINPNYD